MTEEQIKQKAIEYARKKHCTKCHNNNYCSDKYCTMVAASSSAYKVGCNEATKELQEENEKLKKQIKKSKELLGDWLQIAHKNHARCYGFVKDSEQFLEEK